MRHCRYVSNKDYDASPRGQANGLFWGDGTGAFAADTTSATVAGIFMSTFSACVDLDGAGAHAHTADGMAAAHACRASTSGDGRVDLYVANGNRNGNREPPIAHCMPGASCGC